MGANLEYSIVVMASSAGGLNALRQILGSLPSDFPIPIAIVQHRAQYRGGVLEDLLSRWTLLKVKTAEDGDKLKSGTIYVAPPDRHLTVTPGGFVELVDDRRLMYFRSAANPLFKSAVNSFGEGVIGIILTGMDTDGTEGAKAIREHNGLVIAQDEETSECFDMPKSAIDSGAVNFVLPVGEIGPALAFLTRSKPHREISSKPYISMTLTSS